MTRFTWMLIKHCLISIYCIRMFFCLVGKHSVNFTASRWDADFRYSCMNPIDWVSRTISLHQNFQIQNHSQDDLLLWLPCISLMCYSYFFNEKFSSSCVSSKTTCFYRASKTWIPSMKFEVDFDKEFYWNLNNANHMIGAFNIIDSLFGWENP